jgi:hypothetical protein
MSLSLHDKNNNPLKSESSFEERLKTFKSIDVWSEEHIAELEEFYERFGRAWWIFCGVPVVQRYENQWINQYRILDGEINE